MRDGWSRHVARCSDRRQCRQQGCAAGELAARGSRDNIRTLAARQRRARRVCSRYRSPRRTRTLVGLRLQYAAQARRQGGSPGRADEGPAAEESAEEQTRPRQVEGSSAAYSLVDVRDGHDVIDWFPADHPPMPDIIQHGPASLMAERGRACGSCHLTEWQGSAGKRPTGGSTGDLHDPAAARHAQRSAQQRRPRGSPTRPR